MEKNKKIAVISEDLAEPWDEGIKNFTYSVARAFECHHEVLLLNVDRSGCDSKAAVRIPGSRTFISPPLFRALRDFKPDILLYVPSPSSTISSFFRVGVLKWIVPGVPIGMVAMIPRSHSNMWKRILKIFAPDVVFVLSYASRLALEKISIPSDLTPLGVNLELFRPTAEAEKAKLRDRYNISRDAYVYLHVGHMSRKRNLMKLTHLKNGPAEEVIIVCSTSTPEDAVLRRDLEANGIRVIREYVRVEEFVGLADCYVFPVEDHEGSVEMPLSVLEAIASGLPVLATPFGGLRDFFTEGPDVLYWTSEAELKTKAARLRTSPPPKVRSMEAFSWDRVAAGLLDKLSRK